MVHQLKQLAMSDLVALIEPYWEAAFGRTSRAEGTIFSASEWQETFLKAAQEEATSLGDAIQLAEPLFLDEITTYTPEAREAMEDGSASDVLSAFLDDLPAIEPFDYDTVNGYLRNLRWRFKSERGISGRQVMFPIRAVLTGTLTGPCLVITITLLGKTRCLQRIQTALKRTC